MRRALALAALAVGCTGGPSGSDAGVLSGDGGTPLGSLCDDLVDDICRALMECYGADYRDLEHCRADQFCPGAADLQAELARGWVVYDAAAAQACHERFVADPCAFGPLAFIPTVQEILARCEGATMGTQALGAPCAAHIDCAEGYCPHLTGVCPGRCEAWEGEGEPCDFFGPRRCDPALVCRHDTCARRLTAGDACTVETRTDCLDDGLWCDVAAGMCRNRVGDGEECGDEIEDPQCAEGLVCVTTFFTEPGTCAPLGAEGAPCGTADDCLGPLRCDRPSLAVLGACSAPLSEGAECHDPRDCSDGLRCLEQVCSSGRAAGEACIAVLDQCADGLLCEEGVCLAARYPGEPCDAMSVCVEGLCTSGTCASRAPLGATCDDDDGCRSRACESGSCADPSLCL